MFAIYSVLRGPYFPTSTRITPSRQQPRTRLASATVSSLPVLAHRFRKTSGLGADRVVLSLEVPCIHVARHVEEKSVRLAAKSRDTAAEQDVSQPFARRRKA